MIAERLDEIMDRVLERRLLRTSVPERDEETIANIMRKWEASAAEEHARLLESRNIYGGYIGNQPKTPVGRESLKKFTKLTGLKKFKKA